MRHIAGSLTYRWATPQLISLKKIHRSVSGLLFMIWLSLPSLNGQGVDLDGDGLGDLWAAFYNATGLQPSNDDDGDGATNQEEEIAGTDPLDRLSVFGTHAQLSSHGLRLSWMAHSGKRYQVELTDDLTTWSPSGSPIQDVSGFTHADVNVPGPRSFARIRVADLDQDNDGLNAWEEAGFALSDLNATSNGSATTGDYASVIASLESPSGYTFRGKFFPGQTPPNETLTLAGASRFLQQATLGADYEMIESVVATGIPAWIDAQMALPMTSHVERNVAIEVGPPGERLSDYIWTWWDVTITAPDLLRQRVGFALSEIFVIGQTTDALEDHNWGIATYYDVLLRNAFGNFRDLLYEVTTNPAMGHYLSHVKNRPTDIENNIFPDENYAREVMQLFSIGLWELNLDGTRKKDGNGNDIPTYDNTAITEFARVFTGLTYNPENPNNGTPYYGDEGPIESIEDYLFADPAWMAIEMAQWEPMHETGEKRLLYGETTDGTLQEDLDAAIDNLFNHPNVGPFIGRLLIQRLVKSNPSPAYIARVASAFNDNGSGVRGDMQAFIRAILLDPEARSASYLNDPSHGKLREPLIRHLHFMRAFNVSSSDGRFRNIGLNSLETYKQKPMQAPSVFNYYLPDHQPLGVLKDNGLFAPEFQITTATTTIKYLNLWLLRIPFDEIMETTDEYVTLPVIEMDYSEEVELANDPDALLNRLDILLTRGQMTPAARTIIRNALVAANNSGTDPEELARFAITLVVSSPDYAVLR